MTNGVETIDAWSPSEVTQFRWEGWAPIGEYDPPLPDGSPGPVVDNLPTFVEMMNALYVRKDDLVIANDPPATPKGPGVIFIDNSTGA